MPNHDHERDHKPKPKPQGPKEREMAVTLTVAALRAADVNEPLEIVARKTLALYDSMLAAVSKRAPAEHDRDE